MNGIKKLLGFFMSLLMFVSFLSVNVFAKEKDNVSEAMDKTQLGEERQIMTSLIEQQTINLNDIDLSIPFYQRQEYVDEQGSVYESTLSYRPNLLRGQSAAEGTWTLKFTGVVFNFSFEYDMSKQSNGGWTLSNPRNHRYNGLFCTFENARVYVSRANSTSSFPAEVNQELTVKVFDNAWIPLYTSSIYSWAKVDHDGDVTYKIS